MEYKAAINKETYEKIKDKDVAYLWQPYTPFKIQWTIVGDREEVKQTNRNIVLLQERDNKRIGLSSFLKNNYTKFYL